jgi:hypothetical protein
LAWKSSVDPFTLAGVDALAGVDQATNRWGAYGEGFSGYAQRYGAGYGNVVIGTYLGGAVLPSILKQDPRYYYRGTGSKPSRLWYALSRSVDTERGFFHSPLESQRSCSHALILVTTICHPEGRLSRRRISAHPLGNSSNMALGVRPANF